MAGLAYAFVNWRGGDGAGHVGWGFSLPDGRVCVGSVENHSGHFFTPAKNMGFWIACVDDARACLRPRQYETAAIFDVESPDVAQAYAVTQWIKESAYRALTRNCEDDAYDVLRAYGVRNLEAPLFNWLPRWWFSKLRTRRVEIEALEPLPHNVSAEGTYRLQNIEPLRPTWRVPWHPQFHGLMAAKLVQSK